ncbi:MULTISPECIES: ABC transporter permease [Rhizobium/Agrobacterium group]|uniref:ABC transporter permease n=1 Tax=Rhizobium rhizogenes TaxID=359 RepID=A0A546X3D8_RHIRH|nr:MULTISPECIES: ABC transporter permease [Rhizobium/Agrobacterium group]TRA95260.1 ABC transporter permease [Rhizobium rhizogenes]
MIKSLVRKPETGLKPLHGSKSSSTRRRISAIFLIAPLFALLAISFVLPLFLLLLTSVHAPEIPDAFPRTSASLSNWDSTQPPSDEVYTSLADDIRSSSQKTFMSAVAALNQKKAGFRSLLLATRTDLKATSHEINREELVRIDKRWDDAEYWRTLKASTSPITGAHLLAAFDLSYNEDGQISNVPSDQRIYISLIIRTFWVALVVACCCVVLGYPVAWTIAHSPERRARILLLLILVPLWTSLLARTAAWMLLLQKNGLINEFLMYFGLISSPLELLYTRGAVYIAMIHMMLPFVVLPILTTMKTIGHEQIRAAKSLGAKPAAAFFQVYFPQTMQGVVSGGSLAFIVTLGFYITPTLVGGARDAMLGTVIAQLALQSANWPMASALAVVLLGAVAVFAIAVRKLLGEKEDNHG